MKRIMICLGLLCASTAQAQELTPDQRDTLAKEMFEVVDCEGAPLRNGLSDCEQLRFGSYKVVACSFLRDDGLRLTCYDQQAVRMMPEQ